MLRNIFLLLVGICLPTKDWPPHTLIEPRYGWMEVFALDLQITSYPIKVVWIVSNALLHLRGLGGRMYGIPRPAGCLLWLLG